MLTPDINNPTESEFVAPQVRPRLGTGGFGMNVSQIEIGAGNEPADTIGRYFSEINEVERPDGE